MTTAMETARPRSRRLTSLPSASATSAGSAPARAESGISFARRSSSWRIASAVPAMPLETEAASHDPPSTGDCGRVESPSFTLTASSGRPSMSAATWAMIV